MARTPSLSRFASAAANAWLIAAFVLSLCIPTIRNLAGPQPATASENRALASAPQWQWRSLFLVQFPGKFEAYYNDHFGYRHKLIDALNNIRVHWLRTSSSPQVCLGKEGWLYYQHMPPGGDYPTERAFTPDELLYWQRTLEVRRDWLRHLGIPYVFVVTPDKQSIYPEMLPRRHRRRREHTRLDQLLAHLREQSDIEIVDLRPSLRDAKPAHQLFFATDSHWTQVGAYVGYRALVDQLSQHVKLPVVPAPGDFLEVSGPAPGGDLARMLGIPNQFCETHRLLVPRTTRQAHEENPGVCVPHLPPEMQPRRLVQSKSDLPRAVMFHDSFAKAMLPFLGEHFRTLECRWLEPYEFDFELIAREKPDIVIQQIVERKLGLPFPLPAHTETTNEAVTTVARVTAE